MTLEELIEEIAAEPADMEGERDGRRNWRFDDDDGDAYEVYNDWPLRRRMPLPLVHIERLSGYDVLGDLRLYRNDVPRLIRALARAYLASR